MNKKTEKILTTALKLGLGALGIWAFIRGLKKGVEELEEQEAQETEDLENAGVDTSKLRSEIKEDEKDFTSMLYNAVRESDIDLDLFELHDDVGRAFRGSLSNIDGGNVIHVRQIIDTINRKGDTRRKLEFLLEIGDWFRKTDTYRVPKINQFLTTLPNAAESMSKDIVKFSEKARHKLVGYVVVSYDTPDGEDVVVEYRRLVKEVYGKYADDKHDGLTKFYEIEKTKFNTLGFDDYECDWIYDNCPDLKEKESVAVEDIILMYSIKFPIRSKKPNEVFGIDLTTAIKCIKYLTEDVVVGREGGNKEYRYNHLIFHAPDPETNEPSLVWYYDVDENENVIIDNNDVFYDREVKD